MLEHMPSTTHSVKINEYYALYAYMNKDKKPSFIKVRAISLIFNITNEELGSDCTTFPSVSAIINNPNEPNEPIAMGVRSVTGKISEITKHDDSWAFVGLFHEDDLRASGILIDSFEAGRLLELERELKEIKM